MSNNNTDKLYAMRHSLAHIMATAISKRWPDAKFGVGPVVENGFYYDVDLGDKKISEEDFATLEEEMKAVIKADYTFEKSELEIDKAIKWAKDSNQPYKQELLNDLKRSGTTVAKDIDSEELGIEAGDQSEVDKVSFYKNGPFTDLCRGPHAESTGKVGAFKLMRVSGAYWRGKETNPQMQRVYGVAFETEKELRQYLNMLEEAKKRDHRKLGQELDLFVFSPIIGSGLPMFTPKGTILRQEIERFAESFRLNRGYQKVWIPHIAKIDTYKTSGHFEKFPELLRFNSSESGDELALKPVNCPHHTQIYASKPRSYRDLPIKYLETTTVYRDEKSGELGGLNRVRAITQDDSHVFCADDQIEGIFSELIEDAKKAYDQLGLHLSLRLSFRDDSDAYLGDIKTWNKAENAIELMAKKFNLEYEIGVGEAAIYGPKMDFMATDALNRKTQLATVQLDYAQPERFGLEYIDDTGAVKRPIMVHCALLGSTERFLSVYIEHTAGKFPVWLAPEQIRFITVNQEEPTVKFAEDLKLKAKELGLRITVDNSNESVGKKIRSSEVMKVPYAIVIGQKEIETGMLAPRTRKDLASVNELTELTADEFLSHIAVIANNL